MEASGLRELRVMDFTFDSSGVVVNRKSESATLQVKTGPRRDKLKSYVKKYDEKGELEAGLKNGDKTSIAVLRVLLNEATQRFHTTNKKDGWGEPYPASPGYNWYGVAGVVYGTGWDKFPSGCPPQSPVGDEGDYGEPEVEQAELTPGRWHIRVNRRPVGSERSAGAAGQRQDSGESGDVASDGMMIGAAPSWDERQILGAQGRDLASATRGLNTVGWPSETVIPERDAIPRVVQSVAEQVVVGNVADVRVTGRWTVCERGEQGSGDCSTSRAGRPGANATKSTESGAS
jgi:hypothetical protein